MKSREFSINLDLIVQRFQFKLLWILILCAVAACGCNQKPEIHHSVTEAQKIFQDKCLTDFNLHVRTRQVGDTFWIYLPIKEPIFDYEVQKSSGENMSPAKYVVAYADGTYKNKIFSFEYDILDKKKNKEESPGFSSSYTDAYVKYQNNLFTAIYEIFLNTRAEGKEILPKFFVVVITDIKKGIETRATFLLDDFVRFMSGAVPYDEYVKRFLSDRKGSPSMIGDETGSHIRYTNISMSDFLSQQIVNRINFKFQYSDFPPGDNYDNAIVDIIADTLRYYSFTDYSNVRLNNIRLDKKLLFEKAQLVNFGEDKPNEGKGRLIHIRFKDGEVQFDEPPSDQSSSNSPEQKN